MLAWLKKEPRSLWACGILVVALTLLDYLQSTVIAQIETGLETPEYLFYWYGLVNNFPRLAVELFLVVIAREVAYRAIPLFLAVYLLKKDWMILSVAFISSLIFGWRHEWGFSFTTASITVSALVFCLLYLKCGGWRGAIVKPISAAVASHYLFNMLAFAEMRWG